MNESDIIAETAIGGCTVSTSSDGFGYETAITGGPVGDALAVKRCYTKSEAYAMHALTVSRVVKGELP